MIKELISWVNSNFESILWVLFFTKAISFNYLGGGYWTGGINPGLIWLWPGTGRPLSSIASGQWSDPAESQPSEAANGKCLRLSYDRVLQRYALQVNFLQFILFTY